MTGPPASVTFGGTAPGEGAVVAAQQPAHSPRSGRFEGGGRRLVSNNTGEQQQQSPRSAVKRSPRVQTMEDMDKRIAQDALTLINMKREIVESQKAEVVKAQALLAAIRKEHDTLHVSNERLLSQINSILAKANSLEAVDKGVKASGSATQELANSFRKQIEEADEMNTAEQRTLRMQQLMVSRLDLEIAELRALSAKATFKLDTLRHELVSTESTLMLSKQERGAQEHKFNEMRRTIDGLTKERNNKIHMMQSIIDDGEMSLSRVQGSVFDTLKSPRARSSASRTTTRTGESPTRTEEQEDFELSTAVDARPEVLAKRLSVNRVREMVARYNTRASRMEKLERLEGELRDRVAAEKARRVELQEQLDDVRARHHTIASSRTKMYKDMDDKANALWKAKKTCDDWQEREQRLRGNIQAIQRAVPRLLSKLTKAFVAVPTVEDLPDAVQKLEDEILRVFKATSAAVLKDAPPEEVAAVAQGAAGPGGAQVSESEIARLHKLPGFSKLQKQLFSNMMAAKPDNSVNNVRVAPTESRRGRRDGDSHAAGASKSGVTPHFQLSLISKGGPAGTADLGSSVFLGGDEEDEGEFVPQGLADLYGKDEPSLEGETIKLISSLVIERDGGGWSKVLERRAAERLAEDRRADKKKNKGKHSMIGKW